MKDPVYFYIVAPFSLLALQLLIIYVIYKVVKRLKFTKKESYVLKRTLPSYEDNRKQRIINNHKQLTNQDNQ